MYTLKSLLIFVKLKIILLILVSIVITTAATTTTPRAASRPPPPAQQQAASTTLLTTYDKLVSSSPLGEPVFRLQPPNVIEYSNTQGTTLVCLASGSPKPKITWYASGLGTDMSQMSQLSGDDNPSQSVSSWPVTNITNVRIILQDGAAVRLLPFQHGEYRNDVHSAEYRCVASNPIASIHSKSVSVQAVVESSKRTFSERTPLATPKTETTIDGRMDFIRVDDKYVQLKAPAVLLCRLTSPSSSTLPSGEHSEHDDPPGWSHVDHKNPLEELTSSRIRANTQVPLASRRPDYTIEWFTSDGLQIRPTDWPLAEGEKFVAFDTGELHLASVDMADLRRTYGCRLRNRTSRRQVAISNMAQLILIEDNKSSSSSLNPFGPPQIKWLHTTTEVIVVNSDLSGENHRDAPHYASSQTTIANRIRAHLERDQSEDEERLPDHVLLPCAVRVSAKVKSAKGRWLYRPPQASDTIGRRGGTGGDSDDPGARPIGLEQLVGIHKRWLQLIDQTSSPAAAGHRNQSMPTGGGGGGSKLLIRPTFLAIERPRKQLSGRYIYQLLLDDGQQQQQQQRAETICDINVIVSEPIRLRMAMGGRQSVTAADNSAQTPVMGALTSGDATNTLTRWFGNWLIGSEGPTDQRRYKRTAANDDDHDDDDDKTQEDTSTQDLLGQDPSRIQVTGPGSVPQTPIVRVGDRLELQCLAQGYPIDSVRWFRQGRAINTQSSSDFQTEITTTKREQTAGEPTTGPTTGGGGSGDLLVSRLLIRQLQPRELGLQMFECFAQNSLGDRARASQAVLVVDRRQVSEARNECPLDEIDTHRQGDDDEPNEMTTTSGPSGFASARSGVQAVFQDQNPFRRALVLEGEPIELHCPIPSGSNDEQQRQIEWLKWTTPPAGGHTGPGEPANADHHHHHQATDLKQQSELATSATRAEHTRRQHTERARQFNQLFGGESRFVINGSSLQIRSPSKRHDETLFVCARRWRRPRAQRHGRLAIDGPEAAAAASSNKLADPSSGQRAQQADFGHDSGSAGLQRHRRRHYHSVHQSSLAAPPPLLESPFGPSEAADHQAGQSCMESLFSLAASASVGAGEQGAGAHHDRQQHHQVAVASAGAGPPLVSSISIRIVARPRIDPFEFSRDLEEGMRTVVVCTVVSGQSQVDINWFKDGELLLMGAPGDKENDGLEVDSTNKFSSTLTLHKIRPSHSGHYTCVVSNAFASAEHTSRLLVNVAPYFVEPPKSQRAYLGSSVLINCRAAGQPSPQIRWRKLVPVGGATGEQKLPAPASRQQAAATDPLAAPSGGGLSSQQSSKLAADSAFYLSSDFDFRPNSMLTQQMALAAGAPASGDQQQQQQQQHHQLAAKHEFRIITSNSHIQVLENGSMIIRDVELADAARYSCQASNGVQPVLSEVIHLDVLTPAQFEVNYEKVSVKRDSLVRFNCAPRGDQPMQIEWFKEGQQLVRSAAGSRANELNGAQPSIGARPTKYSELIKVIDLQQQQQQQPPPTDLNVNTSQSMRHFQLMLLEVAGRAQQSKPEAGGVDSNRRAANVNRPDLITFNQEVQNKSSPTVISSELIIDSADRADSGLFVCVASNLYGKDELSYRLLVQEPPDAPLNLQVQAIQSSSLRLLWQTPFDGNTPISYFIVEYRKLPQPASGGGGPSSLAVAATSGATANQVWSRVVVSHSPGAGPEEQPPLPPPPGAALMSAPATTTPAAKTNSVALKQLAPKSSYQIRVAAVNPIGQGLFSPIQLVSTAEEAPQTKPADLRAQALSSSSIKLMWRGLLAQPQDQAPVRGYYVSHRRHSPTPETTPTSWLATVSLSATNYSSALDDNLLPIINQIDQQQQQQVSPGQLVNYELQLGSLERNAKYEVRVQPFNLMGLGPAAELTVQTLKFDRPAQPVMRLVAARKQSLELKWSVVANELTGAQTNQSGAGGGGGGELQGFSLYYKCEYDDWREISLAVIFHYVVDNLRCGNKYQIYLSAYNSVGRSDPSDVLSVRTEGSVPLAPERALFFKLNISEVVLDMASWSSGGCPISSFMIQFKRLHDSNWYILSEGATPFTQTDKITIPDLAPASWYKLMVNALNEAGSTNAEYIFATLTLDGQQLSPPDYLLDLQQQPLRPNKSTGASSLWAALSLLLSGGGGGRNQDSPLLLPLSCILLLTVTSLATYLYYSKHADARRAANKQLRSAIGKPKQCAAHPTLNNHLQPGGAGGNLQMLDRHLLGASHSSCLNGLVGGGATADSASSSGSSSSAAQQQQRQGAQHRHQLLSRTMTLHRPTGHHHHLQLLQQQQQQIEKQHLIQSHLPGAMSSKSQLVLSHDGGLCGATNAGGGYLSQQQVRLLLNHQSDPPPNVAHQQNYTGNQPVDALPSAAAAAGDDHQLTNYVLDTFLNQQVSSSSSSSGGGGGGASQQTSFVCGSQPVGGACRAATMKLFTGSGNPAPERRQSNSYFDCGASSSLSSSGLGGSAHTTTSNQHPNQLHLIGEREGQQQVSSSSSPPPPPLDGYELNLNDQLLACGGGSCQYETQQQQQHQEQSHVDLVQQQQQQQHRLLASSSFASAADLIQRQQQQQAEPIYQRLDRFKACALPACVRQFATMNPHMANKLKQQFEQHSTDPIDTHETVAMSMASEQPVAIDTGACFYPPPFAASGDYNQQQECDGPAAYDLRQQSESHNADLS